MLMILMTGFKNNIYPMVKMTIPYGQIGMLPYGQNDRQIE